MTEEIMVSVSCITYNHERYITDAIEGFIMQKTTFPFEVLIHDDASTDNTAAIIKDYEKRYPDIIKPIYQAENQHSKGVKVGRFNRERAKGKYIALCEGDDYWIDPYKLQKQVNYMEKHPECSLVVHASYNLPVSYRIKVPNRPHLGEKLYTVEEVIKGGGLLFATSSMLYPAVYNKDRPKFLKNAPVGDYPLTIYLATCGTVYYMDELMSVYRVGIKGSWTDRVFNNCEKLSEYAIKRTDMLNEINAYTDNKYNKAIKESTQLFNFDVLLKQKKYKAAKKYAIYKTFDWKKRLIVFSRYYFPTVTKIVINLKRKLTL